MIQLEKINRVSIIEEYKVVLAFLKAMGYNINELTLPQIVKLKLAIIEIIEATDLYDENDTSLLDKHIMSKFED
jgi:hypothetical protein